MDPEDALLKRIVTGYRTIGVYGRSRSREKAACRVPAFLRSQGHEIIPINPSGEEILGVPSFSRLAEVAAQD